MSSCSRKDSTWPGSAWIALPIVPYAVGTYDTLGNVLSWTNRRGQVIAFTYNSYGQITSKDFDTTPGVENMLGMIEERLIDSASLTARYGR